MAVNLHLLNNISWWSWKLDAWILNLKLNVVPDHYVVLICITELLCNWILKLNIEVVMCNLEPKSELLWYKLIILDNWRIIDLAEELVNKLYLLAMYATFANNFVVKLMMYSGWWLHTRSLTLITELNDFLE